MATPSRELAKQTGLSSPDYLVLTLLRGGSEGGMRAFELDRQLGWEKSRVSHHVARMVQRGLMRRQRCDTDHRGAFVVVTPTGPNAIDGATPVHLANVRRCFVDLVTTPELQALNTVTRRVLEGPAGGDSGRAVPGNAT